MNRLWLFLACFIMSVLIGASVCRADEAAVVDLGRKIESILSAQQFNELEAMAQEYRQSDSRLLGGNAKLYHFYGALGGFAGEKFLGYQSQIPFENKRQIINMWLVAKPTSPTARLAMAQLWLNYAWAGRGGKYAGTVRPDQWKLFAEGLNEAERYLKDVDSKTDPHTYYVLLDLAQGRSSSRKKLDALYEAAVHSYPTYFHYYSQRAVVLQEKWFGRKGELAEYSQSVLRVPGGDDGQIAYSYIAFALLCNCRREEFYQKTGLSWSQVKAAYAVREKHYGLRNKDWNALCKLAIAGHDHHAAKEALQHIGDNWDSQVWNEKQDFDAAVAWIRAN